MITGKINAVPSITAKINFEKELNADICNRSILSGSVDDEKTISGSISSSRSIGGTIDYISGVKGSIILPKIIKAETYSGEYEVTPKSFEQELATKSKNMKNDVLVHKIPYYETSNQTGTTVYIGGD